MQNEKMENQLNLALDATEQEREKSLDLDVGYDTEENTWEVIVKYTGSGEALQELLSNRVLLSGLTIGFNNAVLAEASMSYLCIGVTPPDASLGYMLSESQGMFMSAPWYALGTGLTLVWMVFGVGLIGEGLQRRGGGEA